MLGMNGGEPAVVRRCHVQPRGVAGIRQRPHSGARPVRGEPSRGSGGVPGMKGGRIDVSMLFIWDGYIGSMLLLKGG
jgi:hypothetical protein